MRLANLLLKFCAPLLQMQKNNKNLSESSLVIKSAFVDQGPVMKRFRPRAQGRAYRILKSTSHITIIVVG